MICREVPVAAYNTPFSMFSKPRKQTFLLSNGSFEMMKLSSL
jgi:hypothetical protein